MPARWLIIRGREYPDLGPLGSLALPDGGAVALSRGARPKAYSHVDPNEDGVLLYRDNAGALLCVVDGYNGVAASECALDATLAAAPELIRLGEQDRFYKHTDALARAIAKEIRGLGRSRTCLLLATLVPGRCRWASFGDSGLYRGSQPDQQNRDNRFALRPEIENLVMPDALWLGEFDLGERERVALMSDGVLNFVPDPSEIQGLVQDAPDDLGAAQALARRALRGGAGDNVAVATLTLYPGSHAD